MHRLYLHVRTCICTYSRLNICTYTDSSGLTYIKDVHIYKRGCAFKTLYNTLIATAAII